jgi:hypothetical protein
VRCAARICSVQLVCVFPLLCSAGQLLLVLSEAEQISKQVLIGEHGLHICGLLDCCIGCLHCACGQWSFPGCACNAITVRWLCQSLSESGCVSRCVAEQGTGRGWAVQSITVVIVL